MNAIQRLITDHIDIWTGADIGPKSGRGRSTINSSSVYGIKKLRELILELAVGGKLVPQESNDEPASELLKRIQAEKAKLIAEGKIKKDKPLAPIADEDKPFKLPQGWERVRLGVITQKLTDGSHNPPSDAGSGLPMLSSQNINLGKIDFNSPSRFVTEEDFGIENSRTKIESNDVLLTIVGSLGRSAVVPNNAPKFVLQRSVAVIKTELFSEFLCLQLSSPPCANYFDLHGKGTAQKGIYLGQLSEMPIVVPSIAEQHRIVAKVDELMALCDQLEAQHSNAAEAHEMLVSHLLDMLTQSQSADDFSSNWQRIAAHFDTLFTTEASIDALKQTLLQLAVMGKLVQKDLNDEPASELLKRIQAEKAKLIAEGKLKKEKPLAPISDNEKQFELPKGWSWIRLGEAGITSTGGTPKTSDTHLFGGNIPFIGPGQISQAGELLIAEKYLTEDGIAQSTLAESGDVLMVCIGGSIGKTLLVNKRLTFNQQINCVKPILVNSSYLNSMMNSIIFQNELLLNATGSATPIINRSKWDELLVSLPPLAEQHRIVAKVDALMALCDQLKIRIQQANQQQQTIADALVAQVVA